MGSACRQCAGRVLACSRYANVRRSWAAHVRLRAWVCWARACMPGSHCRRSNAMESLRVLIADDHPLFRHGIAALLQASSEFEVVGEATTGEEALTLAEQLQPDVILMDIQMPAINGIEATRHILHTSPH